MSVHGVGRSSWAIGGTDGEAAPAPAAGGATAPGAAAATASGAVRAAAASVTAGKPPEWVAMYGFDQVAARLGNAIGSDRRLSREEAWSVATALRDAGRGADAQAASAIVRDFPEVYRPDGSLDLGKARQVVEARIKNADGTPTPIGKLFFDIGRVAGLPPRAGRISARVPEAGLDHAAALIKEAAGPDKRVSTADLRKLIGTLEGSGRGAEALAVQLFHEHADARDGRTGNTLTARQIDAAVADARTSLVRGVDTNRNGLSGEEVKNLPPVGKAFIEVGRRIEAGFIPRPGSIEQGPPDPAALAARFDALAEGLYFISESDYPFDPFHAPLDPRTPLDEAAVRRVLGLPAGEPVDMRSGEDWFRYNIDEAGHEGATLQKWKTLEAAMRADLRDLKLIYTGPESQVEAKVYVVGRAPDGAVVGLSSTRIWT